MLHIKLVTDDITTLKIIYTDFLQIKKYIEKNYKIKVPCQEWLLDGKPVNIIKDNKRYCVYNNNYINLKVNKQNKLIILPQLPISTKIKDINKIFNFNNLYYKNKKLEIDFSIAKYNISNNTILNTI
uniref:Uncharacterized protein n=1 Tax=Megaviridae environmental sample TaxID=1737588 RepID=A0A5J6VKL6_9VIRU|nr:MAG: hypothetical protein [Megaviridae environmental sample]